MSLWQIYVRKQYLGYITGLFFMVELPQGREILNTGQLIPFIILGFFILGTSNVWDKQT
ncbi:hypothetical protein [Candidatus Walczuchella endosymbiont of Icerya purchasi]|uniref:hypothetical protein n=1 Tax=Candidatus Walczuchella endosymbiont of Icerya purchasi TaxID=3066219 RepID=UPI00313E9960